MLVVALLIVGVVVLLSVVRFTPSPVPESSVSLVPEAPGEEDAAAEAHRSRTLLFSQFDLSGLTIDANEMVQGTKTKDQIQAIVNPSHTPVREIDDLPGDLRLVAVTMGGGSIGYPLSILTFHEIINDRVAGTPIAVTY